MGEIQRRRELLGGVIDLSKDGSMAVIGAVTYNGSAQQPTPAITCKGKTLIAGTDFTYSYTNNINAGTATCTATGDGKKYKGSVSKNFTINKASGSSSISPTSLTLEGPVGTTGTISVTRSGDGAITAISGDTSICTTSVSGTAVTAKSVSSGNTNITIKVAAGTNYTAPSDKTCSVAVSIPPTPGKGLENYTWEEIKYISETGNPAYYGIKVGDTKTITLNGKIGDNTFTNQTAKLNVIGINHDSGREGNGITFQLYSVGSVTNVALVTANLYDIYTSSYHDFVMNTTNTNAGGWKNSYARSTLMPEFKSALPSELQNVIKSTTKYSDNTGGGRDTSTYVTATSDEIFLLAEYEIFGSHSWANSAEQNYQAWYDYYKTSANRKRYSHKAQGTAVRWWERSVHSGAKYGFCRVDGDGGANDADAFVSFGLAPAFRV